MKNLKKTKRLGTKSIALLLILLLLLPAVAACADAGEGNGTTAGAQGSSTPATEVTPSEAETGETDSLATEIIECPPATEEEPEESASEEEPSESASAEEDPTESLPIYSDTETEEATQIPSESEEESEPPSEPVLHPVDLGGYLYKAYVKSAAAASSSVPCEDFWVDPDHTYATPLYLSVYERNLAIETDYNCRIKQVGSTTQTQYDELRSYYLDGVTFELAIVNAMGAASCAVTGLIQDVASLPNIRLERTAFDQSLIRDLSIGGKVYFLSGDMNISTTDATPATIYNPDLFGNYDFGTLLGKPEYNNLYRLVEDGKWTVDALLAMANAVNDDADRSGGVLDATAGDTVGYFQYSASDQYYFWGGGARVSTNGSDGFPTLSYGDAHAKEVFDFLFERLNVTVKNPALPVGTSGNRANCWSTGKTLFTDVLLWEVRKIYSEREEAYGILPIPKMTETQERHFGIVYFPFYEIANLWTLPTACENAGLASLLLDAMAVYSTKTTWAAYENSLFFPTKEVSPAARRVLDTVRKSSTYDLSLLYDWGGFISGTLSRIDSSEENGYANTVTEEALAKANEEMNKTLQGFRNPQLPDNEEESA